MTHYKTPDGKPRWRSKRGQLSGLEKSRRESLVDRGLASKWKPLRDVDDAIEKAGLP